MYSAVLLMALSGAPADVPAWGCHRCHGCWGCSGCYGCSGCWGCWGGRGWGCSGCWGGGWGCCGGGWGCYGGYAGGGCYGGWGCSGYAGYGCGGYGMAYGGVSYYGGMSTYAVQPGGGQILSLSAARAVPTPSTIVVSLPEDAKLTVDDTLTTEKSSVRRFTTPPLDPNRRYYYTLKGEIVRDGQTLTATKRIEFRGGQEARISLDFDRGNVAQK